MKKALMPTFLILICALLISVIPTDAEAAIYEDTVRLHILANSDTEDDQRLKLTVRDAVLLRFGESLCSVEGADEAARHIEALLPEIEMFCEETVRSQGYSYSVNAIIGKEYYPTREYEGFTLPAGEYASLRILIGEGEGQNWWCVMYPPLCLGASVEEGSIGYTEAQTRLVKNGKMKVKFKLLELISSSFR